MNSTSAPNVYANFLHPNPSLPATSSASCSSSGNYGSPANNTGNPYGSYPSAQVSLSQQPMPANFSIPVSPPIFGPSSYNSNTMESHAPSSSSYYHPSHHLGSGMPSGMHSVPGNPNGGVACPTPSAQAAQAPFLSESFFNHNKIPILLVFLLVMAVGGFFLYRYYQQQQLKKRQAVSSSTLIPTHSSPGLTPVPPQVALKTDSESRLNKNKEIDSDQDSDEEEEDLRQQQKQQKEQQKEQQQQRARKRASPQAKNAPFRHAPRASSGIASSSDYIREFVDQQGDRFVMLKNKVQDRFQIQQTVIDQQAKKIEDLEINTRDMHEALMNFKKVLKGHQKNLVTLATSHKAQLNRIRPLNEGSAGHSDSESILLPSPLAPSYPLTSGNPPNLNPNLSPNPSDSPTVTVTASAPASAVVMSPSASVIKDSGKATLVSSTSVPQSLHLSSIE